MDLFDFAHQPAPAFPIRKGIPIPQGRERTVQAWEKPDLPFASMEIGDCFDVWPNQCGGQDIIRVQNFVSGAASTFRSKNEGGRTFTTRQIQGQFVRCWRVK